MKLLKEFIFFINGSIIIYCLDSHNWQVNSLFKFYSVWVFHCRNDQICPSFQDLFLSSFNWFNPYRTSLIFFDRCSLLKSSLLFLIFIQRFWIRVFNNWVFKSIEESARWLNPNLEDQDLILEFSCFWIGGPIHSACWSTDGILFPSYRPVRKPGKPPFRVHAPLGS